MALIDITITLYKSELTYDVLNKTYLTGRSRDNGNNHEEVAHMIANEDEENLNQVLRSLTNAYALLKTKLSEYLSETDVTANDILTTSSGTYSITLKMPSNTNKATRDTIAAACHQYLVNIALAEWFTITDKADAADYSALAAANLEQLREALHQRVRPTRTTVTP